MGKILLKIRKHTIYFMNTLLIQKICVSNGYSKSSLIL